MAAKRGASKKGKGAPRKAASNRGLRNQQRAARNQQRLQEDLQFYERSGNIPVYTPVRKTYNTPLKGKGGKIVGYKKTRRIVGYKNERSGETVTPKYHAELGRAFTTSQTGVQYQPKARGIFKERIERQFTIPEQERAEEFIQVQRTRQRKSRHRGLSIAESYQIKQAAEGNPMSIKQIQRDPDFIALVDKLESFTNQQRMFNADNYEAMVRGSPLDYVGPDRRQLLTAQAAELREIVGEDPEYIQVLVDLGRRLPGDTRPVGSYKSGELKLVVQPYYEAAEALSEP